MRVVLFTEYHSHRSYVNCSGNCSRYNTITVIIITVIIITVIVITIIINTVIVITVIVITVIIINVIVITVIINSLRSSYNWNDKTRYARFITSITPLCSLFSGAILYYCIIYNIHCILYILYPSVFNKCTHQVVARHKEHVWKRHVCRLL